MTDPWAPPDAWFLSMPEGQPPHLMVRAAQLALSLSAANQQVIVRLARQKASPRWRDLLSAEEQRRIKDLLLPFYQEQVTFVDGATTVWVGQGAAAACQPAWGTSLVLLAGHAPTAEMYQRVWRFASATASGASTHLPVAVDVECFAPGRVGPPTAVLLVTDGQAGTAQQLVQWLKEAGAAQVRVFDPNDASPAPRSPAERARFYAQCGAVIAVGGGAEVDNHFQWEAIHQGLQPLAAYLDEPVRRQGWTALTCRQALVGYQAQAKALGALPRPGSFADLAAAFLTPPAPVPAQVVNVFPHTITFYAELPFSPSAPILLVIPGEDTLLTAQCLRQMRLWRRVVIDTRSQPTFFAGAVGRLSVAAMGPSLVSFYDLLQKEQSAIVLDVVHLSGHPSAMEETLRTTRAHLQGRFMPNVVLHQTKRFVQTTHSSESIGIGVATDSITQGLTAAAPGRFMVHWLSRQASHSDRGRVYLYPYGPYVGHDGDELDYASLPRLLGQHKVHLLCSIDPILSGSLSARAWWAKRPVPVVGMLHSIHGAAMATDAIFAHLSGPTFAFDCLVSPSTCGLRAHSQLMGAAHEWLLEQGVACAPFAGQFVVIPYGIDLSPYQGLHGPSCREAFDLPRDAFVLLSLGRFNRREKADLFPLLVATQALRRSGVNAYLLLAGGTQDGCYASSLLEAARALELSHVVRLWEDVSADDKVLLYGACDVFVALSDNVQETYGLTLIEAMAAHKPVVASAWNGYREIVRHDQTGLLIPVFNGTPTSTSLQVQRLVEGISGYGHRDLHETTVTSPADLLAALQALARDPERRCAMGEAGYRLCVAEYDQRTQGRRLGDLLLGLMQQAERHTEATPCPPPFVDPVGQRFAHYSRAALPAGPLVRGHTEATVFNLCNGGGRTERALLETIIAQAERRASTFEELAQAAAEGHDLPASHVALRVMRCLKYDFLRQSPAAPINRSSSTTS